MKRLLLLLPVAALAVALLVRAEPAVTIRAVDLKATPAADAKTVVALPANANVDVLTRQGAWVQVKSGNNTGWTKLFDVRAAASGAPAKGGGGNTMAETLSLATGARGSTVTTGVRGLDADMLSKAVPNAQEYAVFESYAVTKDQATVFARAGRLESRTVETLAASSGRTGAAK
jgi:hypothetical protein